MPQFLWGVTSRIGRPAYSIVRQAANRKAWKPDHDEQDATPEEAPNVLALVKPLD